MSWQNFDAEQAVDTAECDAWYDTLQGSRLNETEHHCCARCLRRRRAFETVHVPALTRKLPPEQLIRSVDRGINGGTGVVHRVAPEVARA
jgi:hypothetical protein